MLGLRDIAAYAAGTLALWTVIGLLLGVPVHESLLAAGYVAAVLAVGYLPVAGLWLLGGWVADWRAGRWRH